MASRILIGTDHVLLELSSGRPELLGPVAHIAARGADRWALIDDNTVWRSQSGDDWSLVGAPPAEHTGRCLLPAGPGVFIGTAEAHLMSLRPGEEAGALEGFEHAPGRDTWYTPWGGPPDVRSMSTGQDGAVYANVHVGGVLRSGDGGGSWQPTIDIDADVHQVLAHPHRAGSVLAATAYGLARSDDAGATWSFETDGLHAEYCRAVAVGGDALFVSASRGPRGQEATVYRRGLDRTGAFVRCDGGLPEWFGDNVDTHCLVAADDVVAVGAGDAVWISNDGGSSWDMGAAGLPPIRCLAVVPDA